METIHKVAAMVIRDGSFLMVRKRGKDVWTSLGGHIEEGETEEQALVREVREELGCGCHIIRKLGDFEAEAVFDNAMLKLSTYLVELEGEPRISDPELDEFRFITESYAAEGIKLPQSITDGVIPFCVKSGLLKWRIPAG